MFVQDYDIDAALLNVCQCALEEGFLGEPGRALRTSSRVMIAVAPRAGLAALPSVPPTMPSAALLTRGGGCAGGKTFLYVGGDRGQLCRAESRWTSGAGAEARRWRRGWVRQV